MNPVSLVTLVANQYYHIKDALTVISKSFFNCIFFILFIFKNCFHSHCDLFIQNETSDKNLSFRDIQSSPKDWPIFNTSENVSIFEKKNFWSEIAVLRGDHQQTVIFMLLSLRNLVKPVNLWSVNLWETTVVKSAFFTSI